MTGGVNGTGTINHPISLTTGGTLGGVLQPLSLDVTIGYELSRSI